MGWGLGRAWQTFNLEFELPGRNTKGWEVGVMLSARPGGLQSPAGPSANPGLFLLGERRWGSALEEGEAPGASPMEGTGEQQGLSVVEPWRAVHLSWAVGKLQPRGCGALLCSHTPFPALLGCSWPAAPGLAPAALLSHSCSLGWPSGLR